MWFFNLNLFGFQELERNPENLENDEIKRKEFFFFKRQYIEFRFLKNLHNDQRGGIFSTARVICRKTHLYRHHLCFWWLS